MSEYEYKIIKRKAARIEQIPAPMEVQAPTVSN